MANATIAPLEAQLARLAADNKMLRMTIATCQTSGAPVMQLMARVSEQCDTKQNGGGGFTFFEDDIRSARAELKLTNPAAVYSTGAKGSGSFLRSVLHA